MNRPNPRTDLFTLIGMMATIAGIFICLFFLFTPATFGAVETGAMIDRSPDLQLSMRWIQPILGQAIVEDAVIRQRSIDAGATASSKPASGSLQWVLGRIVVELNRSRMVVGLSEDERIVAIVRHAAQQFQEGVAAEVQTTARIPEPLNVL
ncbi:MAG TPA: hypothetical protein VF019_06160 [Nitrospira sp.]